MKVAAEYLHFGKNVSEILKQLEAVELTMRYANLPQVHLLFFTKML